MAIEQFTRANSAIFRDRLAEALAGIARDFDLDIRMNGGSFDPRKLTVTVEALTKSGVAALVIPGFTADDIGKTEFTYLNSRYRITGFDPSARVNKVLIERIKDHKPFSVDPERVLTALGRGSALANVAAQRAVTTGNYRKIGTVYLGVYPGDWGFKEGDSSDTYINRERAMFDAIPADKIISFPVADGQACYFVENLRPLRLQHIPAFDAYRISDAHIRGLRAPDVEQMLARAKGLRDMFTEKKRA
jgi:hypothetical protein